MAKRIVATLFAISFIALSGILTDGCYQDRTVFEQLPQVHTTNLYASEYARNYYFVDTLYRRFWEQYHASPTPALSSEMIANSITRLDLWKSLAQLTPQYSSEAVFMTALLNLPPHDLGEQYTPGLLLGLDTSTPGQSLNAYWIRLVPGIDYTLDPSNGTLRIETYEDPAAYAVSYSIVGAPGSTGKVFGDSVAGTGRWYLKLVKPPYLSSHPDYQPAWSLMLKNIYHIGRLGIYDRIDAAAFLLAPGDHKSQSILGYPLLRVLGLDRFDASLNPGSDGRFDYIPGVTIDPLHGDVFFPTLLPFDDGIREFFRQVSPATLVPDSLLYPTMYDTLVTPNLLSPEANKYLVSFSVTLTGNNW